MTPRLPPAYHALRAFLAAEQRNEVTLTFATMEELVGLPLPPAAWQRAWWSNSAVQAHAQAWLGAGWHVRWVRRTQATAAVTFVRSAVEMVSSGEQTRRRGNPA